MIGQGNDNRWTIKMRRDYKKLDEIQEKKRKRRDEKLIDVVTLFGNEL